MSNRVEDLERQVAELQAAVNGLTEELVEMKARVRQIESAREAEAEQRAAERRATEAEAAESSSPEPTERTTHSDDHTDVVKRTSTGAATDSDADEPDKDQSDDIVVPESEATTPDAEAAKREEQGEETESGESGDSDIIVA